MIKSSNVLALGKDVFYYNPGYVRNNRLPVISLFSGAGGLDLGFKEAGFYTFLATDYEQSSCATIQRNFPDIHIVINKNLLKAAGDYINQFMRIAGIPISPIGVIGGPPCQAFSQANVNGKAYDSRATLTKRYADFINEINNKYKIDFFLFENVSGLLLRKHKNKFNRYLTYFRRAGFILFQFQLNALDFGVPQDRSRIFVVGFNKNKFPNINFTPPAPTHSHPQNVGDVFRNLPIPIYFNERKHQEAIPYHPNHWCMTPKSKKFRNALLLKRKNTGRSFRVLKMNSPSPTVAYGHNEVNVHPNGKRRISVFEAMLLQGFPFDYEFIGSLTEQIRLVSNAVPPPLARAIAQRIIITLQDYKKTNSLK
jgi:DNA (cytosine-5)-methyltransferase 1